ncbi:tyrosine-type recombinase/integrase [Ulvibacterium marinum]|uniref:Core-binding (CB) domain-containing protein n=1 Tax=Ulvibacterium marinum TaxID=2419782 RepID=A0A3B0CHU6_9FLAO|nr:tyrosine-type recombinase/integrase [Ulvibacterium marinum]RKN83346.1 hypothetical protein D7Z94_05850 [Ulvibacterium marinum]
MATVNYLYRSTKDEATINVRLLFRFNGEDSVIGGKTRLKVSRNYWETTHKKTLRAIREVSQRNAYNEVNQHLTDLEAHILDEFHLSDPSTVNKEWLKDVINKYYDPEEGRPQTRMPRDIVNYIEYYLDKKKNDISVMSARRIRVVKHKMQRMEEYLGRTLLIKDVNEDFKKEFQDYYIKERYSPNTQQRELKTLKSICYHAMYNGLETHPHLKTLQLKLHDVQHIYLNFEEIERIADLKLSNEYLDNARDWLIISCYTGQRVSDFLRFTKDMIRTEKGKHLLEFKQKKTGKLMTIPVLKEVMDVLGKRGGDFPRAISDQKYNDYIKDVAKAAGLGNLCTGKRRVNIKPNAKKGSYRDIVGDYPKWQLVSSHIGRRSFATNFYGKVPTSVLIGITGHSSESQFLNYIQKSNQQSAIDAYKYFN